MILTVFGTTGQVGKRVVNQALALGLTVRAFGRNVSSLIDRDLHTPQLTAIHGYVLDEAEVKAAVAGADAVISVLGGAFDGKDQTRSLGMKHIVKGMEQTGVKRIAALGGMGILNANEHQLIIEQTDYPEIYRPVGKEHLKAFQYLAGSTLDWTFVCAPDILDSEGNRQYITAANYPPAPNHYQIPAGDLAHCLLTCILQHHYVRERVGISRL